MSDALKLESQVIVSTGKWLLNAGNQIQGLEKSSMHSELLKVFVVLKLP